MALAILSLAIAHSSLAEFSVQTGLDYTSGTYGASEDTRILYVPLTFKAEGQRYFARVTIPYIEVDAPVGGDIIAIVDSQPISTGDQEKNSGVGDVVAALGYSVLNSMALGTIIDIVGKVKFGTADEEKGLGTGEDDYSVQIDGYKVFKRLTYLLTAGYRVYGDPPDLDFEDVFFGSLGAIYKFNPGISGGLVYDFRDKIITGGDEQSEVTAFATQKLTGKRKIQAYVLGGLSDASTDWGGGLMFTQGF
jgi:hypothetical protein